MQSLVKAVGSKATSDFVKARSILDESDGQTKKELRTQFRYLMEDVTDMNRKAISGLLYDLHNNWHNPTAQDMEQYKVIFDEGKDFRIWWPS